MRRFAQLDGRRRALVVEAVAWLMLARLALIAIPFPALARRFGTFVPPADERIASATASQSAEQTRIADAVGWAVTRAARYLPFKATCLPQAMAARIMLKRRGVGCVIHFGAAPGGDKPLGGHAWLDAAGVEVTGYPVAKGFAEIACFV